MNKITDLDVIHLVAKTNENQNSQEEQAMSNDFGNTGPPGNARRGGGLFGIINPSADRIFPGSLGRRTRARARDENNSKHKHIRLIK